MALSQRDRTTVLVVDDDQDFRHWAVLTLTRAGFECVEARDVVEARAQLSAVPDVAALLCDIRMPGQSGLDLLKGLQEDVPDVAVVMVTGLDDPAVAQLAFESGAFGYLIKPFTGTELLVSVTGALARRELEATSRGHVEGLERAVERMRTLQGFIEEVESARAVPDEETVERLTRALSLRDEETGGHIERMSRYAKLLAEATGASSLPGEQVRLVAALHDVGKIGVADSILLKPGPLTPVERLAMQRHAQIGYQLLAGASSPLLRHAADVALCHHEWWDGRGYPRGLHDDEIPREARIAAVTDVFDALSNDRVYRPAIPVDESTDIMGKLRGRQFEPRLFDAFMEALPDILEIREQYPDKPDEHRIRVLVVDDHELFVQSLVRLLSTAPDIKVVGQAGTVADGVSAATRYEPDVVLMDFELPDGTGVDATRQIKALVRQARIVMLTGRSDRSACTQAIDAGCAGFVAKHQTADVLIDAIRAAHDDESTLSMADLTPFLRELRPTARGMASALGRREVEVLGLVATGLSNKEIAQRLSLSLNTVRNHVQRVLYKLDAHSRLEAVATGVREGIVDLVRA